MKPGARRIPLLPALVLGFTVGLAGWPAPARAAQPLETETARILAPGKFELEAGVEHQSSADGTETAVPLAISWGITSRFELLVEPVPFTAIHDHGAQSVTGVGDVEVTLTSLALREGRNTPALAVAGEVKIPTAKNDRIGSGKTDVTLYLIASKLLGRWDTHLDVGYAFIGAPAGIPVNNTQTFAVAEEFRLKQRWTLVGEVFGSTAALPEGGESGTGSGESPITPEIGGAETVGTLGVRFLASPGLTWILGLSYDNNSAFLIHPGFTLLW